MVHRRAGLWHSTSSLEHTHRFPVPHSNGKHLKRRVQPARQPTTLSSVVVVVVCLKRPSECTTDEQRTSNNERTNNAQRKNESRRRSFVCAATHSLFGVQKRKNSSLSFRSHNCTTNERRKVVRLRSGGKREMEVDSSAERRNSGRS